MSPFLLGVAQLTPVRLDKEANLDRIEGAMRQAAAAGAHAILFPELFLTGYFLTPALTDLAERKDGPSLKRLAAMASRYGLLTVCGWPETNDGGLPYNSAVIIERDGSILGGYRKTHLFGREPEFFAVGDRLHAFDTSLGRVGVAICYDIEFPETARILAIDGATALLTPTANMDPYAPYQAVFTRARAMENGIDVAIANTVGTLDGGHFFGQSSLVGPGGEVLDIAAGDERVLIVRVDFAESPPADASLQYLRTRRPELYGRLTEAR